MYQMTVKPLEQIAAEAKEQRKIRRQRHVRRVIMGYVPNTKYVNGICVTRLPKGIQNWYTTKQLVELVKEAFERNDTIRGKRVCYINGKWRLQIRGKHLRRLLKAMPNVKQEGRMLVEYNNG